MEAALRRAWQCAKREKDVYEATELFVPLVERFRRVYIYLVETSTSSPELQDATDYFALELDTLCRLIDKQQKLALATRVVYVKELEEAIVQLHGTNDKENTGLDHVFEMCGLPRDDWQPRFVQAKEDYHMALQDSIDRVQDQFRHDPSLLRDTMVLLKLANERGQWTEWAQQLWDMVETIRTREHEPEQDIPEWFIPESDLDIQSRPLDSGSFGSVHLAKWNGSEVILKVLYGTMLQHENEWKGFLNEVGIGYKLSHPHVIKLFGACHTRSPPLIVCEYASEGNMKDYLVDHPSVSKWTLLYQAALGLQFLHRNNIVHGDLKLNNILIMADGTAKLGDFGLSRRKATMTATSLTKENGGAIRWRAPECFRVKPTFDSDIYSFAMCVYEAVVGTIPYDEVTVDDLVKTMICDGKLPARGEDMSDKVWQLIVNMTSMTPANRIRLREVISELKEFRTTEEGVRSLNSSTVDTDESSASTYESETTIFGSIESALRASYQYDGNALKWLWRQELHTHRVCCRIGAVHDGLSILRQVVEDSDSPFLLKLYAYDMMNDTFGATRPDINQLKATLHRPDDSEMSTLIQQITDETSPEARRSALDLVLLILATRLFDGDTHSILLEFARLLREDDTHVNAAAAAGIAVVLEVHDSPKISHPFLDDVVAGLVHLLQFDSKGCKIQAASALNRLTNISSDNRTMIGKAGAIAPLVQLLTSDVDECKLEAARALRSLAVRSAEGCTEIENAGGLVPLVQLLISGAERCQEQAAGALANLTIYLSDARVTIANAGAIRPLVQLLPSQSDVSQEAARALGNLAANADNRVTIAKCGAIPLLVPLLISQSNGCRLSAARALVNLAHDSMENRVLIGESGAIGPLIELLLSESSLTQEVAARALGNLAADTPTNRVKIANAGGIVLLVDLLSSQSDKCQEQAATALGNLAYDSRDNCVRIAEAGALVPLVHLLISPSDGCKLIGIHALGNLGLCLPEACVPIANAGAIVPLVQLLSSQAEGCQEEAARTLSIIASKSPTNRVTIVEAGAIVPLVQMLTAPADWYQEEAARALGNLAWNSPDNRTKIANTGAILPLVRLLTSPSDACKQWSAFALRHLATDSQANRVTIANAGAIMPLVRLLTAQSDMCRKQAARALGHLASDSPENRAMIVSVGAIQPLIRLVASQSDACKQSSAFALGHLASQSQENHVMIAIVGAIAPLIELLASQSDGCKEWGAFALGHIASNSVENRMAIVNAGGIVPLVQQLTSQSHQSQQQAAFALDKLAESKKTEVAKMIIQAGAVSHLKNLLGHPQIGSTAKTTLKTLGFGTIRLLLV